jgi:hypothetical protein
MRKSVIAGLALWAAFAAFAGKTHADVNYPWCIMGDTRGFECVFSSREQCMQDGRNRGFGGQCIQNPAYKPGRPPTARNPKAATPDYGQVLRDRLLGGPVEKRTMSQTARPTEAVSGSPVYCSLGRCYDNWSDCAKALGSYYDRYFECWPRQVPSVTAERR